MSQCPLCHAQVKDDFGLIECGGCGAQLIVHMDGRVEHQGAQEMPGGDPSGAENEESPPAEFEFQDAARDIDLSEAAEPTLMAESAPVAEPAYEEAPPAEDPSPLEAPPPPVEFAFADAPETFEPQPAAYSSAAAPDSPDLSDVARFGNSSLSGARDGALRYNLFVEGIDTADVREAFREAISDRKFVWDTDQILRSLRHGKVSIQNVAPSKAYILISRLRNLPVRVRWEQYAIHQT